MSSASLRSRLTLNMITTFSVVIISASFVIYLAYKKSLVNLVHETLDNKTLLAAFYYLEEDEVTPIEHEDVRSKLKRAISRNDIAIYDFTNKEVKGLMLNNQDITSDILDNIRQDGDLFFSTDNYFYNGLFYIDNEGDFVVITRENKVLFNEQIQTLIYILLFVSIGGILIIYLLSLYIGKNAYRPITSIVEQLKDKSVDNLDKLVIPILGNKKSYREIDDLVHNYNRFISIITQTFVIQKNFIDYVSHEIKTPISALLGTIEVELKNANNNEDIIEISNKLQQYISDLEITLSNMLILSGSKNNFEIAPIRIDDIIWKLIEYSTAHNQRIINVNIDVNDFKLLIIKGNKQLLKTAIGNILENAIKYSESPIDIQIGIENSQLTVTIKDYGIGIEKEDIPIITQNFVRGKNVKDYQGKGIGLSLARIIFQLHQIEMNISSDNQGTVVKLVF